MGCCGSKQGGNEKPGDANVNLQLAGGKPGIRVAQMSGKQTKGTDALSKAIEEIEALGTPKREANGLLAFSYYKELYCIIMKYQKLSFAMQKQQLLVQRRDLLRNKKTKEYKELVMEMVQKEEKVGTDLLRDAMERISLNEQEFMQTHQFYMMNPQTQEILMQAQMGGGDANTKTPPSISRQKAKQIFFYFEEKKFESMKKMMQDPSHQRMDSQEDQMKAMMDVMVQQAILSDEMLECHGIEEDEFNKAIKYYDLMSDTEVSSKLYDYMMKLQKTVDGDGMM